MPGWLWAPARLSRSESEQLSPRRWGWEVGGMSPASWPGPWVPRSPPRGGPCRVPAAAARPLPASAQPRRPAPRRFPPGGTPTRTRPLRLGARELPGTMRLPRPATRLAPRSRPARVSERGSGRGLRTRGGWERSVRAAGWVQREGAPGPALQFGLDVLMVFLKFLKISRAQVRSRSRFGLAGPGSPGAACLSRGRRNRTVTRAGCPPRPGPQGGRPAPHPSGSARAGGRGGSAWRRRPQRSSAQRPGGGFGSGRESRR